MKAYLNLSLRLHHHHEGVILPLLPSFQTHDWTLSQRQILAALAGLDDVRPQTYFHPERQSRWFLVWLAMSQLYLLAVSARLSCDCISFANHMNSKTTGHTLLNTFSANVSTAPTSIATTSSSKLIALIYMDNANSAI